MTHFVAASLVVLAFIPPPPRDHAKALTGKRLVMKDTSCAGLAFTSHDTVDLIAEMGRVRLETRLRWLSPKMFVLTETERITKDCPPRNWIYEVESLTAKTARLRNMWTGWNEFPDSVEEYQVSILSDEPEP